MEKPFILPAGTTVKDAATTIHKDFSNSMTFTRLWNQKDYNGQRVERDHILDDKDIIEIHLR
jgi:ribosome-interacting GTPase 1